MTTQISIGDTDRHPIYRAMASGVKLNVNTITLSVFLPRSLYIEPDWEHDMALVAGVMLRRDACQQLRDRTARFDSTVDTPEAAHTRELREYFRLIIELDDAWLCENWEKSTDLVCVTFPLPCELMDFNAWEHWTYVHVGRYLRKCIDRTNEKLGKPHTNSLRAEWDANFPD